MKPTRDEILNEPAGPRLNQWVAEYIMGCREEQNGNGTYDLIVPGGVNQIDFCEPGACWSAVPDYSGEIAAAWEVVEKILSQHTQDIYFGWCIVPPSWRFGFSKKETHCFNDHGAVANSAPLAICRAALLAVVG